jgi:hypothetical protein
MDSVSNGSSYTEGTGYDFDSNAQVNGQDVTQQGDTAVGNVDQNPFANEGATDPNATSCGNGENVQTTNDSQADNTLFGDSSQNMFAKTPEEALQNFQNNSFADRSKELFGDTSTNVEETLPTSNQSTIFG